MMRKKLGVSLAAVFLALTAARELRAQSVVLSTDAVTVNEGSTATFTVRLGADPGGPLSVSVDNTIGLATVTASPNPLMFDSANWNTDQIVTVSSPTDGDDVDNGATLTLSVGAKVLAKVVVTSVDTSPAPVPDHPTMRITLPHNGDVVMGDRAEFFGSAYPAAGYAPTQAQFFIDGVLAYTDVGPGHYHMNGGHTAWNTTLLSDGPHVLRMKVTDNATPARTGTHEITVIVQNNVSAAPSGASGGGGGGGGCGLTGLESLLLLLLRAARRWKS
ncbi:MAG: hypothetical protein JO332_16660 [Planctomycetaceae bacterium]|nr:hypothetical protein [Planctomycetaceae bacterium]